MPAPRAWGNSWGAFIGLASWRSHHVAGLRLCSTSCGGTALFGCGLLRPDTLAWLIVLFVLLSGCVRSTQYLGLNTISYADVPGAVLSKSTSVGVAEQLARGFGIAIGAALLALIAGPRMLTVDDFRLAFFLIALLPLLSALGFLRLSPLDGAEVSGHHKSQPRSA
jgi:hypothetical protein